MNHGATTSQSLPIVFVNGERAAFDAPAISSRDRGLTLADGLFETMRARRGGVFRLDQHLARLSKGLQVMAIPEPAELRRWVQEAVRQAGEADASIRLTLTRGPGPAGLAPPTDVRPTVVVAVNAMPAFSDETYSIGLRAIVASGRRNAQSPTAGLKTLAYTDAIVTWLEAQRAGADEAIFLDTDGHCSEATASNLFAYREDSLVTPPVTCAALPGITRAAVLELAHAAGIRTAERVFGLDVLASADEVFLTSSLRGIAPVRSLGERTIGTGTAGKVTKRLMTAYLALVDRECGAP
jgi:branched-chain amino acid aminotransferase